MKGLIFRELYLGRKNMLVVAAVSFVFGIIGILIRLSMNIGNLSLLSEETLTELDLNTYMIFSVMTGALLLMISTVISEVSGMDYKAKWMGFQYTTPVTEEKYMLAKYLLMLALTAAAAVPAFINAAIIGALSGRPLDMNITSVLVMISCVTVLLNVLQTALTHLLHSFEKAMYVYIVLGIAAYMLFVVKLDSMNIVSESDSLASLSNEVFGFCREYMGIAVIATAVLVITGYFLTTAFMKRREK